MRGKRAMRSKNFDGQPDPQTPPDEPDGHSDTTDIDTADSGVDGLPTVAELVQSVKCGYEAARVRRPG